MDPRFCFQDCLSAIPVMDIPVDDEDFFEVMPPLRIESSDCNVSDEAEAHRAISQRVVPGRPHGAKRSQVGPVRGTIDRVEHTPRTSRRCSPGAFTRRRVIVEPLPASRGSVLDLIKVGPLVAEAQLIKRCVAPFQMLDAIKKIGAVSQRARNGTQTANVLGMLPSRVMPAAIRM